MSDETLRFWDVFSTAGAGKGGADHHTSGPFTSSSTKTPGMFRIYPQNPNGIKLGNRLEAMREICMACANRDIDCLLLPESNIHFRDPEPRNLIYEHAKRT